MGVRLAGWLVGTGTSLGTLGTAGQSGDRKCGTTTGCTGRQRSLGDVWDVGGCGVRAPMEGLTIGPGRTDPHHLAAHQGHLQGHVLVPALGCDADVASDDGGDEGIGDLPVAVRVSFKDLPERVKRVPMAECPQAGGLQPPPPLSPPHAHLVLLATAASVGSPVLPVAAGGDPVGCHVVVVLLGGALRDDAC